MHQGCDSQPVRSRHRLNDELSASQVSEESYFGVGTEPCPDEIGHLSDDQGRDNERPGMGEEQIREMPRGVGRLHPRMHTADPRQRAGLWRCLGGEDLLDPF